MVGGMQVLCQPDFLLHRELAGQGLFSLFLTGVVFSVKIYVA